MPKKKATSYPTTEIELADLVARLMETVQRQGKQLKIITELLSSMGKTLPKESRDALVQNNRAKSRRRAPTRK